MPKTGGTPFIKLFRWSLYDDKPIGLYSDDFHERIMSWKFIDVTKGQDSLELTLDNQDLKLFEEIDARWKRVFGVIFGYSGGDVSPRRVMQIRKITGGRTLRLVAVPDFRLTDRGRVFTYEYDEFVAKSRVNPAGLITVPSKAKYLDGVVRTIANRHGFLNTDIDIEPYSGTVAAEFFRAGLQQNETDMEFLDFIAQMIDYELTIDNGIFSFVSKWNQDFPVREILYGKAMTQIIPEAQADYYTELMSFEPEVDILLYPAPIHRKGYDPMRKRDLAIVGSDQTDPTVTWDVQTLEGKDPMATPFVPFNQEGASSSGTGATDQEGAQLDADADYHAQADDWIKADLTIRGDPRLTTGKQVIVKGVGKTFSGFYRVNEIEHVRDRGGFVSRVKIGRRGITAKELVSQQGAAQAAQAAAEEKKLADEAEEKRLALWRAANPENANKQKVPDFEFGFRGL